MELGAGRGGMDVKASGCARCRVLRMVLLVVLLGGAAGFGVLAAGGSQESSMLATFFGAIAPLLWLARKNRIRKNESDY